MSRLFSVCVCWIGLEKERASERVSDATRDLVFDESNIETSNLIAAHLLRLCCVVLKRSSSWRASARHFCCV